MKCLPSWPDHCEMLVTSVKAASKVAVLALYFIYPKTVPNMSSYRLDHHFLKQ